MRLIRLLTLLMGTSPAIIPAGPERVIDKAGVYIRACTLGDGTLLAGYAATQGIKILRVARFVAGTNSSEASWISHGEVSRAPVATTELDNAFMIRLPDTGRLLFAYREHDKDPDRPGHFLRFRMSISASDDGGKTWKFLSHLDQRKADEGGGKKNGLWEPFLRVAQDGTLQGYYSAENADEDQDTLLRVSKDGGKTWGERKVVTGHGITSRDGMVGIAEVDEAGGLAMVYEETTLDWFSIGAAYSEDDGLAWRRGNKLVYSTEKPPARATAPQVIRVGDVLVASFMTNEDESPDSPDFDNLNKGFKVKVVVSTDGGKEWSAQPVEVTAKGASWPGLHALNATDFMVLYKMHGSGAVSRVFRLVNSNSI